MKCVLMGRARILGITSGLVAVWWPFLMPCAAENDPSIAAVGKPATITARTASPDETAAAPSRLVVSVSDFQPAADGNAVQVVVRALNERTGAEQEVGRFGVMPYGAAGIAPPQVQRFGLALPEDLSADHSIRLNVYLEPSNGNGKGARLKVDGAEIH
jgi:hypothetical protein